MKPMKLFDIGEHLLFSKLRRTLIFSGLFLFVPIFLSGMYAGADIQGIKQMFSIKATSVKKALEQVENSSDYVFIISDKAGKNFNKNTNIKVESEDIEHVVKTILDNADASYSIIDKQIVIYEGKSTTKNQTTTITQQSEKKVSGRVVDAHNEPLIGVSVRLKNNTQIGATTNIDGEFTLTNIPENTTLLITYVGMKNKEYVVKSGVFANIMMEEAADILILLY